MEKYITYWLNLYPIFLLKLLSLELPKEFTTPVRMPGRQGTLWIILSINSSLRFLRVKISDILKTNNFEQKFKG